MPGLLRRFIQGVYAALIPSPERDRFQERTGVSPLGFSVFLGIVEGAVGLTLYCSGALGFMEHYGTEHGMWVLEHYDEIQGATGRAPNTTDIRAGAMFAFFTWHLKPIAWLYIAIALTGLMRCVAFLVAREAVAEPVVWAGLRLGQLLSGKARAKRREAALGPPRRDKFLLEDGSDLVLLTMRPKPEWNERVTIEVRGKHYRLLRVEDRRDGPFTSIAYLLRDADDAEVVRGFVRYEEWDPDAEQVDGV